jgi:RimK family alpha-L-glutamate ligase
MTNNILIIAGGGTKHLEPFMVEAKSLGLNITTAGFSDISYLTEALPFQLEVKGEPLENFDLVYIRLVGKRYEDVSLLVSYAREKGIKIVDRVFEKGQIIRLPIAKSLETKLLSQAGIPVPKTFFARLSVIVERAPEIFGFPFVIKGTVGKQGHAVWSPRNKEELEKLYEELKGGEKEGKRFLAQEFIKASQRNRVFVVGGKAIAAITRPTRWRRRFIQKVNGEFPEGKREALMPIPEKDIKLAIDAANALSVDIAGVDIVHEDVGGNSYVFEVNSAPRWASITKDTGVNVESEILKYLSSLI